MKVLGLIPARGGSKGVQRKNIKKLAGRELITYTIAAAKGSKLCEIIVSTDDNEIAEIADYFGVNAPFRRPAELASDKAKSIDVALHAMETMEDLKGARYDAIMLLQPTTPFRTSEDINNALSLLASDESADSVISVVNVEGHHPARMKYLKEGLLVDPPFCEEYENQNRQELEQVYIRNGAIYLTKRETILNGSFKGNKCLALLMPQSRSVNIDTLFDFEYAEWLYTKSRTT